MFAMILATLIVLAVVEVYVFALVASAIGVLNAVGLVIVFSLVGFWLTKRAGVGVLTRIRRSLDEGRMPGNELIDGGVVLLAGLLLIVPGFVTDVIGLLLLVPFTRGFVRNRVKNRWQVRVVRYGVNKVAPGPEIGREPPPDIIDV